MDSLNAPYTERTIRTIRSAMAASDNPAEQAQETVRVINALGLEPDKPPKPLPEITPEDVTRRLLDGPHIGKSTPCKSV